MWPGRSLEDKVQGALHTQVCIKEGLLAAIQAECALDLGLGRPT